MFTLRIDRLRIENFKQFECYELELVKPRDVELVGSRQAILQASLLKKTRVDLAFSEAEFRKADEGFSTQAGLEAVMKLEAMAAEHRVF